MEEQPNYIFGETIDRTMKVIKSKYTRAFKKHDIDLTTEQWVIIDILTQKGGITQTKLGELSFKNAATLSRIIDLLCKKEYTERKAIKADRRKHKIVLTQKGKNIYAKAIPYILELRSAGWNGLSGEDHQHFTRIMEQIYKNFA